MTWIWMKKIHKKPKENDIFWRWKNKVENYLDLQGKWDQKENINLVKITKKLSLFHKSRENIDENDSNPQGKWEFLLKKNSKKNTFSKWKCKGFACIIGKWKFFWTLSNQITSQKFFFYLGIYFFFRKVHLEFWKVSFSLWFWFSFPDFLENSHFSFDL